MYYSEGFDLKDEGFFKPILNPRILGISIPKYEIQEENGLNQIKIKMDMWNGQYVIIEQKLTPSRERTEVQIRYDYVNINPETSQLLWKQIELLQRLFEKVFKFEHSEVHMVEHRK